MQNKIRKTSFESKEFTFVKRVGAFSPMGKIIYLVWLVILFQSVLNQVFPKEMLLIFFQSKENAPTFFKIKGG